MIDDNETFSQAVKGHMEKDEHVVYCCDRAFDALVLSRNITFDCIFIDYRMPDMNGDDVCRLLRPQNPVALIVGFSIENKHSVFLEAGADAFMFKNDFFRNLDTVLI